MAVVPIGAGPLEAWLAPFAAVLGGALVHGSTLLHGSADWAH